MPGYFKNNLQNKMTGVVMIIISVVILYLSFTMEGQSVTNPGEGSFVPALTSFIMLVCGSVTFFSRPAIKSIEDSEVIDDHQSDPTKQEAFSLQEENPAESFTRENIKTICMFTLLVVTFIYSINYIPFFAAAFIFLVVTMFMLKGVRLLTIIKTSVVTLTVMYFLFDRLFHIVFP